MPNKTSRLTDQYFLKNFADGENSAAEEQIEFLLKYFETFSRSNAALESAMKQLQYNIESREAAVKKEIDCEDRKNERIRADYEDLKNKLEDANDTYQKIRDLFKAAGVSVDALTEALNAGNGICNCC